MNNWKPLYTSEQQSERIRQLNELAKLNSSLGEPQDLSEIIYEEAKRILNCPYVVYEDKSNDST